MSTSRRNIQLVTPYAVSSLTASEGAVLVLSSSADNAAVLPAGANPNPVSVSLLGLSLFSVVSTQTSADVVSAGIFPGIAAASITRGQALTVANASGHVQPAAPAAGVNVAIIGYAAEDASSGERVAINLAIGALQG